ncbi:larval cuticle protein 65Ag1-like [Galleria mellonella]|uniref:Larval cuticle protein 65Ag1-like n=1 Tax=Galleria mellonella TaxID=7137 RepID=A0A6J3C7K9_GALME|nr:larval cuticle protein 65Ag1-like [Galleria mellonella]
MKFFVIFSCMVAVALCAPTSSVRELPAVRHEEVHDEYGQYALRYITAENTVVSERGRLVPSKDGGYVLEIDGQYQFVGDDGHVYVTKYKGDADGFHVDGAHLPQQVPMPTV